MSDTRDGIVDLFPTRMLQRNLPDFEAPNRELLKLVRDLEKANRNLTIDYRDNNLLNLDHPGANWLRGEVNNSVIMYMQSVGIDYSVDWQIHAWANVNRMGDYHDLHNHPHSYLSGTYYVKVPTARRGWKTQGPASKSDHLLRSASRYQYGVYS